MTEEAEGRLLQTVDDIHSNVEKIIPIVQDHEKRISIIEIAKPGVYQLITALGILLTLAITVYAAINK